MARLAVGRPQFGWHEYQHMHRCLETLIVEDRAGHVTLDFSEIERGFPNGFVPLIVLLEHYRSSTGTTFDIELPANPACSRVVVETNWAVFLQPEGGFPQFDGASAVHRFSDEHSLNDLINQKIHQVLERATFQTGVMQSFEWSLNEVAGNVLVHSVANVGWLQVQVHPRTRHMAVVVGDGGVGIPDTIRGAFPGGAFDLDECAIEHALREGITSKPDFGQGKGLTGTLEIVKRNTGGSLSVHSQRGLVEWRDNRLSIKGELPPFPGTFVDIQLNTSEPIDVETALWGRAPVYPFNESMFGRDLPIGLMRLPLKDEATSFGNRITGRRIRNKIENLLVAAPGDVLEIDFSGIDLIASSFADEVFGKLAISLGFVGFASRMRIINLNKFCRGVIDDVVQSRIIQTRTGHTDGH